MASVTQFRIAEAAALLGVSDDTLRRWIDNGALSASQTDGGRAAIDGAELAGFARRHSEAAVGPAVAHTG